MGVWKTREEAYHESKWGYAVVAIVIMIVLSLLGSIFYLIGEGVKTSGITIDASAAVALWAIIIVIIIILIILAWIFSPVYGFFLGIGELIWAIFSNIYILVLAIILSVILLSVIAVSVSSNVPISLSSPVIVIILIILLILFIPFAIFIIDLFSLEHE